MTNAFRKVICTLAIFLLANVTLGGMTYAQQSKVKPVGRLVVEDSKGKILGTTLGGTNVNNIELPGGIALNVRFIVLLQVGENIAPVMVGRDRFYGAGAAYELENCMGTPSLTIDSSTSEADFLSLLPRVAIGPPGNTIYMAIPGAVPRPITITSVLEPSVEFPHRCRAVTPTTRDAVPLQPLVDLLTEFTPPFTLKAAP